MSYNFEKEMNDYNKIIFLADKLAWDQGGIPPYYQQLKMQSIFFR